MSDNTSSPSTGNSDLSVEISATGTAPQRPSYEITPDLQPHADAVLAMDPSDVPTPTASLRAGARP